MIDLHSHTDQSDGTVSPPDLIALARQAGITTLSITDHDTLMGYDQAQPDAVAHGVDLICGIELSTKFEGQSVHLLAYFLDGPSDRSRAWIAAMRASRDERNRALVERLCEAGLPITLEEVQAKSRTMTGRPHFAQVMVEKGYTANIQEAFDRFLDRSGCCYVDREEPQLLTCIEEITDQGGLTSLAHPCRFHCDLDEVLPKLRQHGLRAIEAYHSDHSTGQTEQYVALARRHGLLLTGGSDFHGAVKPGILLGSGRAGNLRIPESLLPALRERRARLDESTR